MINVKDKEILDVKTLSDTAEQASNSIQQRLKLEETKAALQAARDGMEREALRLKQEEEDKKQGGGFTTATSKASGGSGRFSAAAQNVAGGGASSGAGGKSWVPPHLRSGTAASLTRRTGMMGSSGGFQKKVDTKDETLFPDLNTADKILEQEKSAAAYKPPKKTPVGGTWASARASGSLKKAPTPVVKETPKEEVAPVPVPVAKEEPKPATKTTEPAAAAPTKSMPVKKKKKKKDLSTFKPSS